MSDPTAALEREQALSNLTRLRQLSDRARIGYLRTGDNNQRAIFNLTQDQIARLEARVQEL